MRYKVIIKFEETLPYQLLEAQLYITSSAL